MEDHAIYGWDKIGRVFGVSGRTMSRKKDELLACGAVFYISIGAPPKRRIAAFPSYLKAWASKKAAKGEAL